MSEWQDISTAPMNAIPILVYGEWAGEINGIGDETCIMIAHYCGGATDYPGFNWSVEGGDAYAAWAKPTHWMPLPEKPSRASVQSSEEQAA